MFKFKQLLCAAILLTIYSGIAAELAVGGDFKPSRKMASPPRGWSRTSGAKGTLEVIPSEDGFSVLLNADTKGTIGIYSAALKAKMGDKITLSAHVTGEKITFGLFQYGKGQTSSQRQLLSGDDDGKVLSYTFTVTDGSKSQTETIRIAFLVKNGEVAAIRQVKAQLE
ncbi:MAG: hypothetical protein PHE87_10180 [Victivallaceae bacterium]|nr:hypothetical protein [Victivallaceae bacterium]